MRGKPGMRRRIAAAAALALCAAPAQGNDGAVAPDAAHARRVADLILAELAHANGVPGMAAAVERNGRPLWTGAAGHRDVDRGLPVEPGTRFRLASVSKLIAVTAAARLAEQGRLDPDAPVQDLLGDLGGWPAITVRQLAAHSSGIPHYQPVDAHLGQRHYATAEEALALFVGRPLRFPPGGGYSYSSFGYTLLSAAVERAAGRPFLDYVDAEIVAGLSIGRDRIDWQGGRATRTYAFEGGRAIVAPYHDYSYSWGGAGLSASAPDLARWGGRFLAGEIVSPAMRDAMLVPARLGNGAPVRDDDYSVGFGWRVGADGDGARIAHHAGIAIGARSALVVYPEDGVSVALLSNAMWTSSIERTAMMLAAPFRHRAVSRSVCPVGATAYSGQFDGVPVSGQARFALRDGICIGRLSAGGALSAWIDPFPQRDAETLTVIGFAANGGLDRAALVTPVGVFDLRPTDGPGRHAATIGRTRELTLELH